ncbi:hypothetical protein [Salinisphaera sp. T5B8]|uniref:hypothetical protein n=1 Tax=Salinisphaera sp. T5B8 TaxID=1304154 RepID=UPI003340A63E
MSTLRSAGQADLDEVIPWIGSAQQCRHWAGPRVSYPIDKTKLAEQIEWAHAYPFCLADTQELIGFGQLVPKSEKPSSFRAPDRQTGASRPWIRPRTRILATALGLGQAA